jgi:SAM-dependent methyltransferase
MKVLIIGENKTSYSKILNYYKEYIPNNCEIYTLDFNDADYNVDFNQPFSCDKQFDLIIMNNVLEHIYNVGVALMNCLTNLKKGGRLIIRTDNALYFPYYIPIKSKFLAKLFGVGYHSTNLAKEIWNENHYHIFTKNHLINLLKKFDFQIEKVMYGIWKYKIKKIIIPIAPRILIIARKP